MIPLIIKMKKFETTNALNWYIYHVLIWYKNASILLTDNPLHFYLLNCNSYSASSVYRIYSFFAKFQFNLNI